MCPQRSRERTHTHTHSSDSAGPLRRDCKREGERFFRIDFAYFRSGYSLHTKDCRGHPFSQQHTALRFCTLNSFTVHCPVLLMVLFYSLSLTQRDPLPLRTSTSNIFSVHCECTRFGTNQQSKQGL